MNNFGSKFVKLEPFSESLIWFDYGDDQFKEIIHFGRMFPHLGESIHKLLQKLLD